MVCDVAVELVGPRGEFTQIEVDQAAGTDFVGVAADAVAVAWQHVVHGGMGCGGIVDPASTFRQENSSEPGVVGANVPSIRPCCRPCHPTHSLVGAAPGSYRSQEAVEEASVKSVRLSTGSDRVKVVVEARLDVAVEGTARIQVDGDRTTVDRSESRITVRVPTGTELVIGTTSARVEVTGSVGAVSVVTDSGRIEIDEAESVDARTTSARITVGSVVGECRVRSVSGRVEIGSCGGADVATTSGRIDLTHVTGPVRAHCVSGRIEIELDAAHDVDAETVSGRIEVSLPTEVQVYRSDEPGVVAAPEGCDCTVRASSLSGRIQVSNR